jgi:glyoxylase-like metal-dependent hydrolase (beta-lactamase superfamily II)
MKSYIDSIGGLDFILLTHGHFDHFLGVEELIKFYPKCNVYIYEDEVDLLFDSRKNGAKMFLNQNHNLLIYQYN